MATYERGHGRNITADHPQWKRARWTVEFVLKGRRVIQPVPEARTQAQAEQAESQLWEDFITADIRKKSGINFVPHLSLITRSAAREDVLDQLF